MQIRQAATRNLRVFQAHMKTIDTIIVGAGSAGCTLAARLTEDASANVLLLEAGGWDRSPWIKLPFAWGKVLRDRIYGWNYETEPEPALDNRRVECARGKVIGGSSSINAMAYVRGHRADYDRWASNGLPGWSYADVLPYFRRQEAWEGGADAWRGGEGPLTVETSRYEDPLVDAYLEAGRDAGHPATADYNGAEQHGFARIQMTIRQGHRCSASVGYLRPALWRGNLRVETGALVTRILFEGTRAIGVEYLQNGERKIARAEREVILAGGAVNSPQTLMLSGIGDPDELRAHGIETKVPLRGVGKNLQDHPAALITYARTAPGPLRQHMRVDRIARDVAQGLAFGTGFTTSLPGGITAFLKSDAGEAVPDVQLLFIAGPLFDAKPYLAPFRRPFNDGFGCRIVVLRPQARGAISLRSADPAQAPRIAQNLLGTDHDKRKIRAAVKLFREIGTRKPLQPFVKAEIVPGAAKQSDAELDAAIRATAVTVHHPAGSCRMGVGEDAVVDGELRVHGTQGLRVIDASVFPDLPGGNINAAVIMIAEKAADMIRGRVPLR
jgi:choline dehydrogenase/4-pyridoxate dehydrogenase